MKTLIAFILILLITSTAFAQAPDKRICGATGNCVAINADGSINITGV